MTLPAGGRCDMERIAELRVCHVLTDVGGMAAELVAQAARPMREAVRRAWFCHHYVEMRGFHRNGDNPIERGDAVAALFGLVPTLEHALRAAMVLDGEPYPYIKWLAHAARQTPTGSRLAPLVDEIIAQLGDGALQVPGPEETHPLGVPLRAIRNVLIDAARATGIDGPWLERWWLHIPQSRAGVTTVRW